MAAEPKKPEAAAAAPEPAKKPPAETKPAPKPEAKKSGGRSVTPAEREQMINLRAYYLAEERGGGDPVQNWADAEKEIDELLRKGALG